AGVRPLRRPAAARRRRRWLLHQDTREPVPGGASAGGGRVRLRRARRIWVNGVERRGRAGREPRDRSRAAAVRGGVHARALRRSRVSRAARSLERVRPAVVRAGGRRGLGAPPSEERKNMVTIKELQAFGEAWNRHDVDAIMTFMADDCVFETTAGKEVCGTRYEGRERV